MKWRLKSLTERKVEVAIRLLQKENKRVSIRSLPEKYRLSKTTVQAYNKLLLLVLIN